MPILSFYSKFEEAVGYSKEFGEEVWAKNINFGVGSIKVMPTSAQSPSCVLLFAAPWTVVQQVPLSMGFSQQEYWSELSFPPLGIFLIQGSNSGILHLLHWQMDSFTTESPEKPHIVMRVDEIIKTMSIWK